MLEAARIAKERLTAPYVAVGLSYLGLIMYLWVIRRLPRFISESEDAPGK